MHCIFSDGRFFNKALQVAKSTKHAICHSFVTSGQVMWMLMNVVYLRINDEDTKKIRDNNVNDICRTEL